MATIGLLPTTPAKAPRVFVSYSHDSAAHKDWVLTLATRLVANGVHVIFDQWDIGLGGDLPRFMEQGLTDADRVLAVCSEHYVRKANGGHGGVGYEKMILTAQLMENVATDRIIPIVWANSGAPVVPTFLGGRRYLDFRPDHSYESCYAELIRDIHGVGVKPRPPLGPNPFLAGGARVEPRLSFSPARYVSPATSGTVTFDYSNNNGRYVVGAGDMTFETAWSGGSASVIHAYNDPPSIRTVALAQGVKEIADIADAALYDTSSRVRTPHVGEIVVWQNTAGYYLATKVEKLRARNHGSNANEITFSYVIAHNRAVAF